jgi:uncharacterized integral membrane protein
MRILLYIVWAIIAVYVVVFTILNSSTVELKFYFTSVKIYLPLLLLLNLIIGALLGIVAMLPILLRTRFGKCEKEDRDVK